MRGAALKFALLGLAVALGGCQTRGGSQTPVPTTPPTASVTPASASPWPATAFRDWTRVDMRDPAPGVYGGGTPSGLVAFGGGYVAVGTVFTDCCDAGDPASKRGVLWTSDDGRSWTLHDPIAAFAHATLAGVVTDGVRLIAFGSYALPIPNEPVAAVWTSTDGAIWARTGGKAPSMVAAGPRGVIGAIVDEPIRGLSMVRFATSADGLAWTETSGDFEVDLRAIAVAADGTALAVGAVPGAQRADGSPTTDLVVWRSVDGAAWANPETPVRDALPIALTSDGTDFLAIVDVYSQLANGSIDGAPELWRFSAGAAQLVAAIPIGDEDNLSSVFVAGDILLGVGDTSVDDTADVIVWVSTDGGATWGRVADQAAFTGLADALTGAVRSPDGLVAVGRRWDAASGHPLPEAWFAIR